MIRIRRGVVRAVSRPHDGLAECEVEIGSARAPALAYEALVGPVSPGDPVLVNTTAVDLGLGTGGYHIVVAVEGRDAQPGAGGHAIKLRYAPHQVAVDAVEETHRDAIDAVEGLAGMPVVAAGLHSALAPVAIGVRACAPGARIAFVMTDGGALALAFSRTVPALRAAGLVDVAITCGQAFGGDLEAVGLHGALAAARAVAEADVAVVAMGPGNLGTGSRWGFASIEQGAVVNAAASMGGRPIAVARLSFADPRERHRGVSHHTLTALGIAALAPAEVALPPLEPGRAAHVRAQLDAAGIAARHDVVEVDLGPAEDALRTSPVPLRSMGRGFDEDPDRFRSAAAGGVLAARALARGDAPR